MSDPRDDDPPGDRTARNVTPEMRDLLDPDPVIAKDRYRQLHAQLKAHATYHGSQNPEDDASEAIYRGLVNAGKVKPTHEDFRKYVFGILRNVILESLRRTRRQPTRDPDILLQAIADTPEYKRAEASLMLEQIQHLLEARDWALLRRYFRESDHKAHCEELGVTSGYLRVIVHRLIEKAREGLDKMGG
jgi:RNA polymerase sigma factor (sigma-70 family)